MCGIVGIVGRNAPVSALVLERATQSLAHRGPDDGGTIILHDCSRGIEVGLGNRRLAILDLSPLGHQPMHDSATGDWIVYNGEIYNFRELRAKLQRAGYCFISNSDTEVILKSYAHWGESCLAEFRGMFAFAIWDGRQKYLFLARDPMGIKPLYYYQSEKYFLFSSEVRTLLGTGFVPRTIDPAGLHSYLSFGSVYDPSTLVKGVYALPAGHFLKWTNGEIEHKQYFDLLSPASVKPPDGSSDARDNRRGQTEARIGKLLDESVRMQLVSDVPVGVFLSGGIDSSALVGILSRAGVRPSTFSIVFREADYSEAEYSRAVATQFCTDHHEITVSQSDLFAAVGPAIRAMDLPTIDGINTYFVAEKTRAAGVKVALSGLGGDEMFGGYSSFRDVPRMERFANVLKCLPASTRNFLAATFTGVAPHTDQNRKLATLIRDAGAELYPYFLSRMLFTPDFTANLTGARPRFQPLLTKQDGVFDFLSCADSGHDSNINTLSQFLHLDPINRVSFLEARCYMLNTLLRDSDFMSMAHGLEVRVPLIDHQLAQHVLATPGRWKLDSNKPKPLLVNALNGQLPDKIVHRPKRGFALPFEHWLRGSLCPVVQRSLDKIPDGPLATLLDQPTVNRVWQDFLEHKTSWSRPWSLCVLQRWCEQHLSG